MARSQPKTLTRRRGAGIARLVTAGARAPEPARDAMRPFDAAHRHALLIGTTQHRSRPFSWLASQALDLTGLHAVLTAPAIGGFAAPAPLCDQPAFHLAIDLEAFFRDREREDLLLLYVAGHVLFDERGAAFLLTPATDRGRWRSSVIDFAFLRDVMDGCASAHQLILLDCALGSLDAAAAIGSRVDIEAALAGPRRTVLSASNTIGYRLDDDGASGDASAATLLPRIVAGLRSGEADVDGDGRVSLQDFAGYARGGSAQPGMALGTGDAELGAASSMVIARRALALGAPPAAAHCPVAASASPSNKLGDTCGKLRRLLVRRARRALSAPAGVGGPVPADPANAPLTATPSKSPGTGR